TPDLAANLWTVADGDPWRNRGRLPACGTRAIFCGQVRPPAWRPLVEFGRRSRCRPVVKERRAPALSACQARPFGRRSACDPTETLAAKICCDAQRGFS